MGMVYDSDRIPDRNMDAIRSRWWRLEQYGLPRDVVDTLARGIMTTLESR